MAIKRASSHPSSRVPRILIGFRLVEALRDLLEGVSAYIQANQLTWQIQCVDSEQFDSLLRASAADGAIAVVGANSRRQINQLVRSKVPAVNLLQDISPAIPSIMTDDRTIGSSAAAHLIACGFRSFGYLGFAATWSRARELAFGDALKAAGHRYTACTGLGQVRLGELNSVQTMRTMRRWIAGLPKPIAVFACSDTVARALLTACESERIRVPDDVAILGVDNLIATCEFCPVPLSSVAQNFSQMGFEAAKQLRELMNTKPRPKKLHLIPPGPVVIRRSTNILVFNDPYVTTAMQIINDRAAEGVSVPEIMQEVPVSRRWLDERFSQLVGRTVSDEIRQRRALLLRNLLLQTNLSVKQIALRCRFPSPENMIRFFRTAYGMPPSAYRAKHGMG